MSRLPAHECPSASQASSRRRNPASPGVPPSHDGSAELGAAQNFSALTPPPSVPDTRNRVVDRSRPKSNSGTSDTPEAPELIGGPSRTRTLDPLIKSCTEPRTQDTQADLSPSDQSDSE